MGEFVCKVVDARGQVLERVEAADTAADLRQRLSAQGFYVHSVRPRASLATLASLFVRRRGLNDDQFLLFNQQFATLIRAGLPILRALDLLAQRATAGHLRVLLDDIRQRVRSGSLISEAFRAQGVFPEVYTASLLAGERSGNLTGVLDYYIAYQKVTGSVRRRLLVAIVYPTFLIFMACVVLAFVIIYVIPRFSAFYKDMRVELPWMTQLVVGFALNISQSVFFLAAGVAALVFGGLVASRTARGAHLFDAVRLRLPLIGEVLLKFRLTQLCRTLSTLLAGGIPLVPALAAATESMVSPILQDAVREATQRVREGQSLHAALGRSGLLPPLVIEMIEVGESTGALPQMLASVAEFYEEDLNARLTWMLALVEPLLLVCVAFVIAFLLVALYLPVFSVGTVVR